MPSENSVKPPHSKIVLDYSFCNSSNLWNYLGVITILLFLVILISFLKYQKRQNTLRHHKKNYNGIFLGILILLGLFFVVPCMCWLLTLVEILVTFICYGQITASPLPILSLPIRCLAYLYMKIISAFHMYLTASGTFVFLLSFIILACRRLVLLLTLRYGLVGFFLCSWIGFAIPLYALSEVGQIDSWINFAFNCQLPLFILISFFPVFRASRSLAWWIILLIVFLIAYHLKFGVTFLFVCKCLLIIVLVRFTYVIGKTFVELVFFTPVPTNPTRNTDDVQ